MIDVLLYDPYLSLSIIKHTHEEGGDHKSQVRVPALKSNTKRNIINFPNYPPWGKREYTLLA